METLCCKKPRGAVNALSSRKIWCPLGLERPAASKIDNSKRNTPANQYNDEDIAYTPLARRNANPDILKYNG